MDSKGPKGTTVNTYQNLLLLGAIAAASAFVVTILIVLICVGCQRKSKSKHPPAGDKGTSVNMGTLRNPKLNSMSKSDTRLHEINRFPCNGNSVSKSRPASMDLLLLHSRCSQTDLRPSDGRQLPQIPTSPQGASQGTGGELGGDGVGGDVRDHTYTEVGIRNNPTPTHCLDDGLYETVGVREGEVAVAAAVAAAAAAAAKAACAPPPTSASTPASVRAEQSPSAQVNGNRNGNGGRANGRGNGTINRGAGRGNGGSGIHKSANSLAIQDAGGVEYTSIRKFRKADKTNRKENNSADSQSDSQSSVSDSPSAGPPPFHRSQEFPRRPLEPFHLHSFPKEAMFMGNGEQYIWKPPEEDEIITLHPPPLRGENGQGHPSPPSAKEIAETYSIVCKNQKKKPMENNGSKTLPRSFGGDRNASRGRGRGVQAQARSQEEPCYEPVGDRSWSTCATAEPDPAYATIDAHRKREQAGANNSTAAGSATLKRKKQVAQQQQVAPAAQQGSDPPAAAVRGLPGGENFYETISDVKQGASSSGTTTIFTFNDGMEMYVTGL